MKVLHVIPAIAACYGGPSRLVLDTCRALRGQGIDAEIATTNADENGDSSIPGVLPTIIKSVPVYLFRRHGSWRFKVSWELSRWLDKNVHKYDLLHVHAVFSYSTAVAAYYAQKHRVPYIIVPHGMLAPWPMSQNRLIKRLYLTAIERKNVTRAAAVHFAANNELRNSAINAEASFVLPFIVDMPIPSNGHTKSGSKPRVVYLSRLDPKKGLELLIKALADLIVEGREFEFIVAGAGPVRYQIEIESLIRANSRLAAVTSLVGFIDGHEKVKLLESADIFVLPSYDENFGIAVTEAMAAGVAVIISDRVNIHDQIAEQSAGFVVSPNAESVRNALSRLLDDPDLCSELGARGRHLVATKFSSAAVTEETIKIYLDVIADSRHSRAWHVCH